MRKGPFFLFQLTLQLSSEERLFLFVSAHFTVIKWGKVISVCFSSLYSYEIKICHFCLFQFILQFIKWGKVISVCFSSFCSLSNEERSFLSVSVYFPAVKWGKAFSLLFQFTFQLSNEERSERLSSFDPSTMAKVSVQQTSTLRLTRCSDFFYIFYHSGLLSRTKIVSTLLNQYLHVTYTDFCLTPHPHPHRPFKKR